MNAASAYGRTGSSFTPCIAAPVEFHRGTILTAASQSRNLRRSCTARVFPVPLLRCFAPALVDIPAERPYNRRFADRLKSGLWGLNMDKKRLDYYKKKLVAKREELLRVIARTEEEGRSADDDPTVDLADKAANSYTKEFLFGQTNNDRTILQMVEEALERVKENTFGLCVNCQDEMQQKRLEAVPWARHCISCQEKQEQGVL